MADRLGEPGTEEWDVQDDVEVKGHIPTPDTTTISLSPLFGPQSLMGWERKPELGQDFLQVTRRLNIS